MQLAAPRPLGNLGPLVLGDHALELHQQLILGRLGLAPLEKPHFSTEARELLDQQRLVHVAPREPVRRVAEYHLDPDLGHHVAQALQGRTHKRRARVPFVLEHPVGGNLKPRGGRVRLQGRRLTGDRLLLLLPRR